MKKLFSAVVLSLVFLLAFSLVPQASASTVGVGTGDVEVAIRPAGTQLVWISVRNNTNRTITVVLDHQLIDRVYYKSFPPGATDLMIERGRYDYSYYSCGRYWNGMVEFKGGKTWRFSCTNKSS